MYHSPFILSSFRGHFGGFHFFDIVVYTAMNIGMQVSFSYVGITFFGYISRSWIAGSYSRSIFSCLRSLHTDLCSSCTSVNPICSGVGSLFYPHGCQQVLLISVCRHSISVNYSFASLQLSCIFGVICVLWARDRWVIFFLNPAC